MSCYLVAQINIDDPTEYERYLEGFDEVFERFGGTVVAVDDAVRVLEGAWPYGRTVIIRFPSETELSRWYDSEEYQRIARHRRAAARCNLISVSGRPEE